MSTFYKDAADKEAALAAAAESSWNSADYFSDDELRSMMAEAPPFRTDQHRWLSTIIKLRRGIL